VRLQRLEPERASAPARAPAMAGHDCSDCGVRDATTRSAHVAWRRKLEAQRKVAHWVNYTLPDGRVYQVKRGSLMDKDMMHEIAVGRERGDFTDFRLPMEMMVFLDLYNTTTRRVSVTPERAFASIHKHSGDHDLAAAVAHGNRTIQAARRELQLERSEQRIWAKVHEIRELHRRMREGKTVPAGPQRQAMRHRAGANKAALHRGGYLTAPEMRKAHPEAARQPALQAQAPATAPHAAAAVARRGLSTPWRVAHDGFTGDFSMVSAAATVTENRVYCAFPGSNPRACARVGES
jgi:hypothetical protein